MALLQQQVAVWCLQQLGAHVSCALLLLLGTQCERGLCIAAAAALGSARTEGMQLAYKQPKTGNGLAANDNGTAAAANGCVVLAAASSTHVLLVVYRCCWERSMSASSGG
jgi:hypothetical protein